MVDIVSDVIRGSRNLGSSNLIKDLSIETIKSFIREYVDKFGVPRIISGTLLWTSSAGDSYMMCIYKNEKPFDVKRLSDVM